MVQEPTEYKLLFFILLRWWWSVCWSFSPPIWVSYRSISHTLLLAGCMSGLGAVQNLHLYQGPQGGDLYLQSHTPTTLLILLPCNIITTPLPPNCCLLPTNNDDDKQQTTNNHTTDSCSRITLDNPLDHSPNHNKTSPPQLYSPTGRIHSSAWFSLPLGSNFHSKLFTACTCPEAFPRCGPHPVTTPTYSRLLTITSPHLLAHNDDET